MTLRVLAGLLIGLALALGLHPLSRVSLLESFRPASSPNDLAVPFASFRLPDPDDPQSAAAWLTAWHAERYRGRKVTQDQLLLLTEIAQAGAQSEPGNAYWRLYEGLLQHDLGNKLASQKALEEALAAPGFNPHSALWVRDVLRDLRFRDGSTRPSHILALHQAMKTWSQVALSDPLLPVKFNPDQVQLWVEGLARLDFPSPSSVDEAGLAQLPLGLAQSIIFWGVTSTLLAFVLLHPSFTTSKASLADRLRSIPLWLKNTLLWTPLALCTLFCVALGGPGRILKGLPQAPAPIFWSLVALVLAVVAVASALESEPDSESRPGGIASSCAALGLAGGALLVTASLIANPFIVQMERVLGPN